MRGSLPRRGRPARLTQDRLGWPDGNCLETAFAMLLRVPIAAVPDPRTLRVGGRRLGEGAMLWREPAIEAYLRRRSLTLVDGPNAVPPAEVVVRYGGREGGRGEPFDALYWIAHGPGPRGYNHAVVYVTEIDPRFGATRMRRDRLWRDPHPDRTGLLKVDGWTIVAPSA